MRHGMRSYTMGQAWWVGDCGPFWGHNALVRIKPFHEQCGLPVLPGKPPLGGHVLSHDQVEATLMRRAGYEVRVLPEERGSWEENPPTMLEFAQRDVRWCQGNMQYLKLLNLPGLYPMSRFQLVWAILMFAGIPAWTLMIALLPVAAWQARGIADFPVTLATGLYVTFFTMYLMPKIAGLLDAMLTRGGVARYGGWLRFVTGAAIELVFSFLQGAVSTIRTTIFMIGLLFGKSVVWGGQSRDAQRLSWEAAAWNLWPQTLFGVLVCGALLVDRAGGVLVEPAADGRLSAGDPVRRAHRRSALRQVPAVARHLRHPGGFRHAGRGVGGDGHGRCARRMSVRQPMKRRLCCHARCRMPTRHSRPLRRSLDVYYGDPARDAAMDALYARFVRAGDLAFDIGSHVGDRIGAFRRLGARVVALEPQPLCARAIRAIYAGDEQRHADRVRPAAPSPARSRCRSTRPIRPSPPPRPISSARPTAPAAGKARSGTRRSKCPAQLSMRWLPNMARRLSPRSTWRASRIRCWRA